MYCFGMESKTSKSSKNKLKTFLFKYKIKSFYLLKLLSGFDRYRSDNCLAIWDINHNGISSPSSQTISGLTTNVDEYKRVDMLIHNQQVWKPIFEHGMNDQCISLTWFKQNERLFAACTTQHNTRTIKIYDPRGFFLNSLSFIRIKIFYLK